MAPPDLISCLFETSCSSFRPPARDPVEGVCVPEVP